MSDSQNRFTLLNGDTGQAKADIAEVIITGDGDQDIAKTEAYLIWKWFGNGDRLPDGHPYKTERPS
jgi:hypothetical protein